MLGATTLEVDTAIRSIGLREVLAIQAWVTAGSGASGAMATAGLGGLVVIEVAPDAAPIRVGALVGQIIVITIITVVLHPTETVLQIDNTESLRAI